MTSSEHRVERWSAQHSRRAPRVLVVDDEAFFAKAVCKRLEKAGYECGVAPSLTAARRQLAERQPDLVLLDMRLPDGSGLDLLAELRERMASDVQVVVLTAHGELEDAVAAMKLQACDYLKKPVDLDELLLTLEKVLGQAELTQRLAYSRERESRAVEGVSLLGESDCMQEVRAQIERIARIAAANADAIPPTVLILGETGTGKDMAARLLHRSTPRRDRPFVHVDCGALPTELIEAELFGHEKGAFTQAHAARPGLIEAAEDGTVFLDEVAELPLDLQTKLLALLGRRTVRRLGSTEERPVPAWFIAATNRDVGEMLGEGRLRSDLFYRLDELDLHMPPLRERGDDVVLLARRYLEQTARRYRLPEPELAADAVAALRAYAWPGNVRELKHLVERAVLLSGGARLEAPALGLKASPLPGPNGESRAAGLEGLTLEQAEALLIERALKRTGGNVSEAARQLGTTRMALRYRMQKRAKEQKQDV
jgi:two-component system, NtrC family, response regulator AtoC